MQYMEILGDPGTTETITPGNTATGITKLIRAPASGLYQGLEAKAARITCEANTINFTEDGTAPTAAAGTNVGHALTANSEYTIRGVSNVRNFLCIDRVAGNVGVIKVTCFF